MSYVRRSDVLWIAGITAFHFRLALPTLLGVEGKTMMVPIHVPQTETAARRRS